MSYDQNTADLLRENVALRKRLAAVESQRDEWQARAHSLMAFVPKDAPVGDIQRERDDYLKTQRILAAVKAEREEWKARYFSLMTFVPGDTLVSDIERKLTEYLKERRISLSITAAEKEAVPPVVAITDDMVERSARVLCHDHAEVCGVNEADCWKEYGDEFKKQVLPILTAALRPESGEDGLNGC